MRSDEYFAGHFDGEGCVRMAKSGKGYKPEISTSGCHLPTLEAYQSRFGGNIRVQQGKVNKAVYEYRVYSQQEMLHFIDAILPHTWEKSEQLQIVKDFLTVRMKESKKHPSQATRDYGLECFLRLKELKR